MKKKDLKILLSFIIIFLCIGITMYAVNLNKNNQKKKLDTSFIINGISYWQYIDKKWKNIYSIDDIDWDLFKVYSSNEYIDNYYITTNQTKLYFFDKKNNSHNVSRPFLAINKDSIIAPINYRGENLNNTDYNNISEYLQELKIKYNGEYSLAMKYTADINGDNNDEDIYIVSNELYSDQTFYLIFAKVENKYITINKQVNKDEITKYNISWIINIKNKNYYDIILSTMTKENNEYHLYEYDKNNNYKEITPD